jgi:A/G-specific adenine glycosylase
VDGNVLRVIARYTGIREPVNSTVGKMKVKDILTGLIDHTQPGQFNQAMMELGALICKPKLPLCPECPISRNCYAYMNNLTAELPRRNQPKPSRTRFFHYLVIISREGNQNYLWLNKRTGNDIWKNLYDFPLIESESELSAENLKATGQLGQIMGSNAYAILPGTETAHHILSHQDLRVKFIVLSSDKYYNHEYLKINELDLSKYPVPRLIENFLKKVASRPGIFLNFPD